MINKEAILILFVVCAVSIHAISCGTLAGSTTHVLDSDVNAGSNCFTIDSASTTLDCNGFSIIGSNTGVGINVYKAANFIVKNCNVVNFSRGMDIVSNSRDGAVYDNVFDSVLIDMEVKEASFLSPSNVLIENNTFNAPPRQLAGSNIVWNHNWYVFFEGSGTYVGDGFTDSNPSFGEQANTPELNLSIIAIMAVILSLYVVTKS